MKEIDKGLKRKLNRIPFGQIDELRIDLLNRWQEKKNTVVIFQKSNIKKYPFIYFFGLISKDWAGSAGTTMSVITESGWNIATHWGLAITFERQKVGIIVIGIEMRNEGELTKFLDQKEVIRGKLYEVCFEGWREDKLITLGVKKISKSKSVMKLMRNMDKFTAGISEEVIKFFSSRSDEYLDERSPRTISDIILTNYSFIHKIRDGGSQQVKAKHLKTNREKLTGISIGCYDTDFSLLLALDAIREVAPDAAVKYNKVFVTDDKISIYRIEIDSFQPCKRIEKSILMKLRTLKFEQENLREMGRGPEYYGKVIIPKLLKEYSISHIPQAYISPELTSSGFIHFKLIVVKELGVPWGDKYLAELGKINGITVLGYESPKVYQEAETSFFNLQSDANAFTSTESMYTTIRENLSSVIGNFRDFGEGMRQLDVNKFADVCRRIKGVSINLLREFYYGITDFYRVSGAEEEIIELVKLGIKLARGKVSGIKWNVIEDKCTLICITSKEHIFPQVLKMLEGYSVVVSQLQLGGLNFLLLRVENRGRALSNEELLPIIYPLAKRLEIPDNKLDITP